MSKLKVAQQPTRHQQEQQMPGHQSKDTMTGGKINGAPMKGSGDKAKMPHGDKGAGGRGGAPNNSRR